jgi:hypothetical protein
MDGSTEPRRDAAGACTAFAGSRRLASGMLGEVALAVRRARDVDGADSLVILSDVTGEILLDWRGTDEEIRRRLDTEPINPVQPDPPGTQDAPPAPRGRGRPKLGVVSREVTLLPKHWGWLAQQPGGTSVALRTVIDRILATEGEEAHQQRRTSAAYRVITALASDLPGFAEASRALLARDRARFLGYTAAWPGDIREHALRIAFEDAQ